MIDLIVGASKPHSCLCYFIFFIYVMTYLLCGACVPLLTNIDGLLSMFLTCLTLPPLVHSKNTNAHYKQLESMFLDVTGYLSSCCYCK